MEADTAFDFRRGLELADPYSCSAQAFLAVVEDDAVVPIRAELGMEVERPEFLGDELLLRERRELRDDVHPSLGEEQLRLAFSIEDASTDSAVDYRASVKGHERFTVYDGVVGFVVGCFLHLHMDCAQAFNPARRPLVFWLVG